MKPEVIIAELVDGKQLSLDAQGRFWRIARRSRTGRLIACPLARAEHLIQKGYYHVRANIGGRMVSAFAHRVVWCLMHGPIPDGLQINHINGVKTDNRPGNLELCTPKENSAHAIQTGLAPRVKGDKHPRTRLSDDDVRAIRQRRAAGETLMSIATTYGLSHQGVRSIVDRKTWRHVA